MDAMRHKFIRLVLGFGLALASLGCSGASTSKADHSAPASSEWTPPLWKQQPSAGPTHQSVCYFPDVATAGLFGVGSPDVTSRINQIECWPVDADGIPYGRYYVPEASTAATSACPAHPTKEQVKACLKALSGLLSGGIY